MKQIFNVGNLPNKLKSFLTGIQSGEKEHADVFECKYNEIIEKAKEEKLEVQVMLDRDHDRSYLAAVGASVRNALLYGSEVSLRPIFYFAELDEPRKREFQASIREARAKVLADHRMKIERDKLLKEQTRLAGEEYRGKIRPN
jgi:hypothetical protein